MPDTKMLENEEISSIILTGFAVCTLTILCNISRRLKSAFLPPSYQILVEEFICTFQVVSAVKEGDIILASSGLVGYSVFIFMLFVSFGLTFEGSGCTCVIWEKWFFKSVNITQCIIMSVLQVLGGFLAVEYVKVFWRVVAWDSYHLQMFRHSTEEICESALKSNLAEGMFAEFLATILFSLYSFFARAIYEEVFSIHKKRAACLDAFVCAAIVIIGMDYTGMMFNPALASALTLNCKGHPLSEHILVYWVAPFIATILSCVIFSTGHSRMTKKKLKTKTN